MSILLFSNLGFGEEVYAQLQGKSYYSCICFGLILCILTLKWTLDIEGLAERTCWTNMRRDLMLIMMVIGGVGCVLLVDYFVWAPLAVFIVTMPAYFMVVFISEREAMEGLDEVSQEGLAAAESDVTFDVAAAEEMEFSERSTIDQVIVFISRIRIPQIIVAIATLALWVLVSPPETQTGDDDGTQGLCSEEQSEAEKLLSDDELAGKKTCMYQFLLWCAPLLVAGTLLEIAFLSKLLCLKITSSKGAYQNLVTEFKMSPQEAARMVLCECCLSFGFMSFLAALLAIYLTSSVASINMMLAHFCNSIVFFMLRCGPYHLLQHLPPPATLATSCNTCHLLQHLPPLATLATSCNTCHLLLPLPPPATLATSCCLLLPSTSSLLTTLASPPHSSLLLLMEILSVSMGGVDWEKLPMWRKFRASWVFVWFMGLVVLMFAPFLVLYMVASNVNRLLTGAAKVVTMNRADHVNTGFNDFEKLNWTDILLCGLWIGVGLISMQVGIARITTLFLSWFNSVLDPLPIVVVIVMFSCVGILLFMIPVVPGIPVYLSGGEHFALPLSASYLLPLTSSSHFVLFFFRCVSSLPNAPTPRHRAHQRDDGRLRVRNGLSLRDHRVLWVEAHRSRAAAEGHWSQARAQGVGSAGCRYQLAHDPCDSVDPVAAWLSLEQGGDPLWGAGLAHLRPHWYPRPASCGHAFRLPARVCHHRGYLRLVCHAPRGRRPCTVCVLRLHRRPRGVLSNWWLIARCVLHLSVRRIA
jgi:hypothetical protein